MKDWPRGAEKYLPIEAAEFERLLAITGNAAAGTPAQAAARVTAARVHRPARFQALAPRRGGARDRRAGQEFRDDGAESLQSGRFRGTLGGADAPRAVVGLDAEGKLQTLVEHPGSLHFAWSLAGGRDAEDVLVFSFELPACSVQRLALDLPLGVTPQVDFGVITASSPASEKLRHWEFELGGHSRFQLRIVPASAAERPRRLALGPTIDGLRSVSPRRGSLGPVENRGLRPAAAASDYVDGPADAVGRGAERRRGGAVVGRLAARARGSDPRCCDLARADPRSRGALAAAAWSRSKT